MASYIPRWYTRPKTVTRPGTNRAQRALTSFIRRTPLTTAPRRQPRRLFTLTKRQHATSDYHNTYGSFYNTDSYCFANTVHMQSPFIAILTMMTMITSCVTVVYWIEAIPRRPNVCDDRGSEEKASCHCPPGAARGRMQNSHTKIYYD